MNFDEFKEGMDRLVALFNPYRWETEQENEYFQIFRGWDTPRWRRAVELSIIGHKKMPTPAHLHEAVAETTNADKRAAPPLLGDDGCTECDRGMVCFEVERNGMKYDKYLACDCTAGDRISRHIRQMAKMQGVTINDAAARYSWVYGANVA